MYLWQHSLLLLICALSLFLQNQGRAVTRWNTSLVSVDIRYNQGKAGEEGGVQLLWRVGRRPGGSGPGAGGHQAPDPRMVSRGRLMMKVLD